ncbi:hypothetical protein [Burkholderia oklahomensis]|uniref:hypothetical protein n=1 Tax=Burkholderia oklahomensis TaxID=342113 RepID=UPI0012F4EF86|nr:hypothetical protein [Burkholderia oklahomensis]
MKEVERLRMTSGACRTVNRRRPVSRALFDRAVVSSVAWRRLPAHAGATVIRVIVQCGIFLSIRASHKGIPHVDPATAGDSGVARRPVVDGAPRAVCAGRFDQRFLLRNIAIVEHGFAFRPFDVIAAPLDDRCADHACGNPLHARVAMASRARAHDTAGQSGCRVRRAGAILLISSWKVCVMRREITSA